MASDYGLNFGFRVSDETRRSSFGRVRTPKGGAPLLLGTAVEQDPTNPGYLRPVTAARVGAADFAWGPTAGLLVQEESWDRGIYQSNLVDSFTLGTALHDRLSVITSGAGTKVWFKNTLGQTRADGRVLPAVTMFATAGMAVGVPITWDGTRWTPAPGTSPEDRANIGVVSFYNPSTLLVEIFLTH